LTGKITLIVQKLARWKLLPFSKKTVCILKALLVYIPFKAKYVNA